MVVFFFREYEGNFILGDVAFIGATIDAYEVAAEEDTAKKSKTAVNWLVNELIEDSEIL